jgi:hypothetical protein
MDQQEMNQPSPSSAGSSLFEMNLDAQNSYNLRSSASWAKVLGVVGIILGIIFVILTISAMSQTETTYSYRRRGISDMFGTDMAARRVGFWILIITGAIFIMGGIFAFNFGNKVNAALRNNNQQGLNQGFAALRNYFAVRSITLMIVLLLFLLGLAGSL